MQTLAYILNIEQTKQALSKLALQLGFCNLRIYALNKNESKPFVLLVSLDPDNKLARSYKSTLLEAKLIQLLKCTVEVLIDSQLKEFLKDDILKRSVPITETEALKILFNTQTLEQINFHALSTDDYPAHQLTKNIKLADKAIDEYYAYQRYLSGKSLETSSRFFEFNDEQKTEKTATAKTEQKSEIATEYKESTDDMVDENASLSLKKSVNKFG